MKYSENSDINYKVYLKENEFFDDEYLSSNQQYIASIIDYINADFNYKLSLDENIEYKYNYRIEANVDVKHKTTNNYLYNTTELLLEKKDIVSNEKEIIINENLDVNYNSYNNLIKRFVNVYDLEEAICTLSINMYVDILSIGDGLKNNDIKGSVMSLSIPLTTETVAIDISNNLIKNNDNIFVYKNNTENDNLFLIIGIVFMIISLILIIITVRYEIKTRTAENIYEKELKKILNNYGSYIQPLESKLNFDDYELFELDTFTDMLEVRDTIRQPILMKENANKKSAIFAIPSNTKMLYIYKLKVSDIEKNMKK